MNEVAILTNYMIKLINTTMYIIAHAKVVVSSFNENVHFVY